MRDSIVFYRSFYEAMKSLCPEDFKKTMEAIMEYGLNGTEIETDGIAKTVFLLVKPQIDANNKRYQNGTKGGRPITKDKPNNNQKITKTKPNSNQDVTKPKPNVNDNDNGNENDNDNGKDLGNKRARRFIPPTIQEAQDYCNEKGYTIDCERFIDFYEAKGWMIGKNKMKDWKAAIRTWSRSQREEKTAKGNMQGLEAFLRE